ncbi:MAG: DUF3987 domain-containing protein [Chloroflexi bacterium]|uniref:DUF3987 domain-containing protein n=1 Tax=Candidatus Flexifilum breve TaxID=3140694 RepID=UPI003137609E|nr:DUF3987 domain-containing protein [Chloroflexota bacterium]
MIAFSQHDLYALSRAFVGLPWAGVPLTPTAALLLAHLDPNQAEDLRFLRKVLGQELIQAILAIDPQAPPPEIVARSSDLNIVPELPMATQLTPAQVAEAQGVGRWLTDYMEWAGRAANETPLMFHQGAGLYLAAVAVGRRLYIRTPWRQQIFPNLYLMIVAISTYYRKSAGLNLAAEVAPLALPHMIMPQPGSPENFMAMLGGILPPNFSDIPQADRTRLEKGNRFAAQRGLLRDELSGLFKSMGRDYMAGLKELIMTLYDCPGYLDSNTNNKGLVVIRDAALSILGAATPAELANALTVNDWYNGNLARFALLTPETDYHERVAPRDSHNPTELAERLRRLHERLPEPPPAAALGDAPEAEAWSLVAEFWSACHGYEQALRAMTAPQSTLDDRLRAIYGRLHVQAIKVAILLAALDWSDAGEERLQLKVTTAHWYRAQLIVEEWRASAHRLLADLGENEEGRLEIRILSLLRASGGATVRDLYRSLRSTRKPVMEALRALEEDGCVVRLENAGGSGRGPRTDLYQAIDLSGMGS